MRFLLTVFIILIFAAKSAFPQDPYLARLSIYGRVGELGVSPKGDIWVVTAAGKVYYRSQSDQLWRENNISAGNELNFNHFERISFFSANTMMLSGYLQEKGNEDFVFRTEDYGKTWTKVRFGESSWLDGAYTNKTGKAWMTGSSQYIYYTDDGGKTWQTFDKIEKTGNLRVMSLHFKEDGRTGLFGSSWNSLYLTTDNCKSWTKIATPLSQRKYTRVSKRDHSLITKIRILNNHYVIKQDGRTFISREDQIEWQYLSQAVDFEVTDTGNLYVLRKDGSIQLYNPELKEIWTSNQKIRLPSLAIAVHGEQLIALTDDQLYQISPDTFESSDLLSSNTSIPTPELQQHVDGEGYGFAGKDILKYDSLRKQWFRYMQLDFDITNAQFISGQLMVSDQSYNQFYVLNLQEKTIVPANLPAKMIDLQVNPVEGFHLEYGVNGCFHQSNSMTSFSRKGKRFVLDEKRSKQGFLKKLGSIIDANVIDTLVGMLSNLKPGKISIEDLEINQQDISGFKKYIDKQAEQIKKKGLDGYESYESVYTFPGENTDFDFYKQVADSLYTLSPELISTVLSLPDSYWSTTTYTRRIVFTFKDGKKLSVENSYNRPNYLFVPWSIEYGELKLRSNSIQFSKAINRLTKGSFFRNDVRDKNYAIFRIAEYIYKQKIDR